MVRRLPVFVAVVAALLPAGPGKTAEPWRSAGGERNWAFPRDHGRHRDYRTEWWYFTGQLSSAAGEAFGFQLTFFRFGAAREPDPAGGAWAVRDIYAAHFALADVEAGTFGYAERISREGPGLAAAGQDGLDVRLLDWSAATEGGDIVLRAREGALEASLRLRPRGRPLLHGRAGLSLKGSRRGQASWYYSLTDLAVTGEVAVPGRSGKTAVAGWSWFDHEFGSNQLSREQSGWDWFALRLDDGRRIMIYLLRRRDGTVEPLSSGTLQDGETATHLSLEDFTVSPTGSWASAVSGAVYPSGWRIRIPSAGIDLVLEPLLEDQELVTTHSTGVTYWEGAVSGRGSSKGNPVGAAGYVELTGYGGSLGGMF